MNVVRLPAGNIGGHAEAEPTSRRVYEPLDSAMRLSSN